MERTKTTDIIKNMAYQHVSLQESPYKTQRDYTVELYLSLRNGDILHSSLSHAGIADDFDGLPGWGGNLGQFLGAFAKLYSVTGDARLKEKALALANQWADLAEVHPELCSCGTYNYDKMIGGLLDMYEYLGYERAESLVSMLTDRSIRELDRTIDRDGLQDARMHGQIEWYTLPENVFRTADTDDADLLYHFHSSQPHHPGIP